MDIFDRKGLKHAAAESLARSSSDPGKLVLIHTGAALLLTTLLSALDYWLEQSIGGTGGLDGLGTRAMLGTVQSILRISQILVLPFWEIGYVYATMQLARGEYRAPEALLQGFRRFGPVLRLMLLRSAIYIAIGVAASYISSFLLFLTPWSRPLVEAMTPFLSSDTSILQNAAQMEAAMQAAMDAAALPIAAISGVVFLAMAAPVFYRYRMAEFALMDAPEKGALAALRRSRQLMKGNCIGIFRLDLSFWWYYLLELLIGAVCYADQILLLAGVSLPGSAGGYYFLCLGLYFVCRLALSWKFRNGVDVTYAYAYGALQLPPPPVVEPAPSRQPWNYV